MPNQHSTFVLGGGVLRSDAGEGHSPPSPTKAQSQDFHCAHYQPSHYSLNAQIFSCWPSRRLHPPPPLHAAFPLPPAFLTVNGAHILNNSLITPTTAACSYPPQHPTHSLHKILLTCSTTACSHPTQHVAHTLCNVLHTRSTPHTLHNSLITPSTTAQPHAPTA